MKTMNNHAAMHPITWLSFSQWVILTTLSYIPGADLHYQTSAPVVPFRWQDVLVFPALTGFLFGAVSGLIISTLQWLVLKRAAPHTRLWIPLNMLGFGLVHALNDSLPTMPLPFPLLLGAGGLIVGLCQYAALPKVLPRPVWWVPLVAVTWVVAFLIGEALLGFASDNPLGGLVVGNGTKGILTGVITGLGLKAIFSNTAAGMKSLIPLNPD